MKIIPHANCISPSTFTHTHTLSLLFSPLSLSPLFFLQPLIEMKYPLMKTIPLFYIFSTSFFSLHHALSLSYVFPASFCFSLHLHSLSTSPPPLFVSPFCHVNEYPVMTMLTAGAITYTSYKLLFQLHRH